MTNNQEERKLSGYPSADKPWLKYYTDEALHADTFKGSMYSYFVKCSANRLHDIAVNYFGAKMSYGELIEKIDKASMAFARDGIKSGDYVSSFILRTPEFIQVFYGLNKIGAIADMEYVTLSEKEILRAVKEVKAQIVITTDLILPKVAVALHECKQVKRIIVVKTISAMPPIKRMIAALKMKTKLPKDDDRFVIWDEWINGDKFEVIEKNNSDDISVIVHTGGTTGIPKGVMLSNYNFNSLAVQYKTSIFKNRTGKYLCIAPPFVGFGIGLGMHQPLCSGLELCLDPNPNPENIVASYLQYKPRHLLVGPPHYINMIHDKRMQRLRFEQVESLGSGGEKLSKALADEINRF
ncbi:MAG: acyl--CoA ligase, partial [Lachnospiraceae bacterium]|nr:acyl--CoA ligase [Lachnospiraceae bacterium]